MSGSQRTLLVTGGTGLLGANFVAAAADAFRVATLCRQRRFAWPGSEAFEVNIQDADGLGRLVAALQPTAIVHFAAATNVDECERDFALAERDNVRSTALLARLAAQVGIAMVFMSTDSVFDGEHGPYGEDAPTGPVNSYARSKLAGEEVVRAASGAHLIVRANIYGWNAQPKQSLAEWVLHRLERGERVPGFADVFFAPVLVNTLSEIILRLLDAGATGTVHAACRDGLSKFEFAQAVARTFGFDPARIDRVALDGTMLKAPRPRDTRLALRRLTAEFGVAAPVLAEDLARFKRLREDGFVHRLKTALA